jgi:two-component system phosphate regulon sensor histidine kinase PhoR
MTNAPIRILVLFAALILVSIISIQVYWSLNATASLEQQFSHNVKMSLNNVVESVCQINGMDVPVRNPVEQVSNAYFIVHTNQPIQLATLKSILTTEFENRAIEENFEFGVYDCQSDRMIYGDLVTHSNTKQELGASELQKLEKSDYYFGVYFPEHANSFWWQPTWLKWSTLFTLLIFLFFSYAIFILLKQKRLSAVQRDFINNITHELKTPVSSLKIAADVLSDSAIVKQPDRLMKYGRLVGYESTRLESHINQLLRTAELDETEQLDWQWLELDDFVSVFKERIKPIIGSKKLSVDCQKGLKMWTDPYYLETILLNLTENAIKYGGEKINFKCYQKGKQLLIEIWDNGQGITEKYSKRVFERFFRISKGDQHDVKGFGLGLYVVRLLVKRLKGEIKLIEAANARFQIKFKKT